MREIAMVQAVVASIGLVFWIMLRIKLWILCKHDLETVRPTDMSYKWQILSMVTAWLRAESNLWEYDIVR